MWLLFMLAAIISGIFMIIENIAIILYDMFISFIHLNAGKYDM